MITQKLTFKMKLDKYCCMNSAWQLLLWLMEMQGEVRTLPSCFSFLSEDVNKHQMVLIPSCLAYSMVSLHGYDYQWIKGSSWIFVYCLINRDKFPSSKPYKPLFILLFHPQQFFLQHGPITCLGFRLKFKSVFCPPPLWEAGEQLSPVLTRSPPAYQTASTRSFSD